MAKRKSFKIAGYSIPAGHRETLYLSLPGQSAHTPVTMPIHVVHGRSDGPTAFISAAIHGDEINGTEIIRQLLIQKSINRLKGTLICIPVVNMFGFQTRTRYLPDGRDLNRSFPGSERGSLAARMAWTFRREIVDQSDYGIDLHTGSNHRTNYPHIRCNMDDARTAELAHAFNAPVIVDANLRDGSLRNYAVEHNIPMLLYEAGEAHRFDKQPIQTGVRGVLNVLGALGMINRKMKRRPHQTLEAADSHWIRAEITGMIRHPVDLGQVVKKGDLLGVLADILGHEEFPVRAKRDGVVIGRTNLPTVNEGDALFHVAEFTHGEKAIKTVERFESSLEGLGEGDYRDHVRT